MQNHRKTILIAVLVGIVAAVMSYESTPTAPESCKNYREQLKQLVLSDGSFAGAIINVPERMLDEAAQQRTASMTAEQCTAALPGVNAAIEAFQHTAWGPQMHQAGEESAMAIAQCRDKRVNGELKTHADSAQCSNDQMKAAFDKIHYPYMDLVKRFSDTRLEEAQKLDKSLLGGSEDLSVFAQSAFDITDEERKRIQQATPAPAPAAPAKK